MFRAHRVYLFAQRLLSLMDSAIGCIARQRSELRVVTVWNDSRAIPWMHAGRHVSAQVDDAMRKKRLAGACLERLHKHMGATVGLLQQASCLNGPRPHAFVTRSSYPSTVVEWPEFQPEQIMASSVNCPTRQVASRICGLDIGPTSRT